MQALTNSVTAKAQTTAGDPKRTAAAAKEFESVMLNQWLQAAQSSFGAAPGGDEDDDQGGEQMKSFATQRLAGQLAAHGGIGLAKLVQAGLSKAHEAEHKSTKTGRKTP